MFSSIEAKYRPMATKVAEIVLLLTKLEAKYRPMATTVTEIVLLRLLLTKLVVTSPVLLLCCNSKRPETAHFFLMSSRLPTIPSSISAAHMLR